MNTVSIRSLFQICLMIAGMSPTNLTINSYFIKRIIDEKLDNILISDNLTVEDIMATPQRMDSTMEPEEEIGVAIMNNKAYWVKNNQLYSSNINEFGDIDIKNAKIIDVFSLSNSEAKMLLKIVDSLNSD